MRTAFYMPLNLGGILTFHRNLEKGLRAHGWDVLSVSAGRAAALRRDPALATASDHLLCPGEDDPRRAIRALCEWLVQMRVDVLHAYGSTEIGDLAVPYLPSSIRSLVSVHANTGGAVRIASANRNHADAFVCINEPQCTKLIARGVPPERIRLIPHGIDASRPLNVRGHSNSRPTVLYAGALERHKGADLLIPIAEKLRRHHPTVRLLVLGGGSLAGKLAEAAEGRLRGVLEFRGRLDPDAVWREQQTCDVIVVPSRTESFCYSLAEGMLAGRAVVAARLHGVTDRLVDDESGILVRSGDVDEFVSAIRSLLGDAPARQRLGDAARTRITTRSSLAGMGAAYAAALRALIGCERRKAPSDLEDFAVPREYRAPPFASCLPPRVKEFCRDIAARVLSR